MLQNLREHAQSWIAGVIAALLALAFALWGVEYYLSSNHSTNEVAKVNGVKITREQLNVAYERLRQQYTTSTNANISNQAIQSGLKRQALEQLIDREILAQAARKNGYRISANELNSIIMQIPAFQQNGQFSMSRYQQTLSALLYTPKSFLQDLEKNLLAIQQQTGLTESDFALSNETDLFMQLMEQKREVSYLTIPASLFLASAKVSDSEIQELYNKDKEKFRTPEQVRIKYIELTANDVKAKIVISDSDIQQYYENNINSLKNRPLAEVHQQIKQILERQALEKLFSAQVDKLSDLTYTNPTSLQPAAQALSLPIKTSELFSAQGSNTGVTAHPKIVSTAFSDNVLIQNNNSDPVQIGEGDFIVLRVREHQPSTIKPLAQVQPYLVNQIRANKAKEEAKRLGEKLISALQKGDTIEPFTSAYKLTWHPNTIFTRQSSGIDATMLRAAFAIPQPTKDKFSVGGASLMNGDYSVIQLHKIIPYDMNQINEAQRKIFRANLAHAWGQFMNNLYVQSLKKKAKVHIASEEE